MDFNTNNNSNLNPHSGQKSLSEIFSDISKGLKFSFLENLHEKKFKNSTINVEKNNGLLHVDLMSEGL